MRQLRKDRIGSIGISYLQTNDPPLDSRKVLFQSYDVDEGPNKSYHDIDSDLADGVWLWSAEETWTLRNLIAQQDFLYILTESSNRKGQIVDKIPMQSIFDVRSVKGNSSFI